MLLTSHSNKLEQFMHAGMHCLKEKKIQQALLYFKRAILLNSEHIDALIACAATLIDLNRPAEAVIYTEHALQLNTNHSTISLHAKALFNMGRYDEALKCFQYIIAENPNNYVAMGQRALCLVELNRYEEALQAYQQASAHSNNQDAWILYNYSFCLLSLGFLHQGFMLYEYRWLCSLKEKRSNWKIPESATYRLLQGKSILIQSEQGLGDSIQFFRYIPLLLQLGARVFLEIQPALISLFSDWKNTITFISKGASLPTCDFYCPMMSLASLFKTDIHTIPRSIPYVFPYRESVETCQQKLGFSHLKRIGIAWKGSPFNVTHQKRGIALSNLLTLHKPKFEFICLQKDVSSEEKKILDQFNIAYHSLELNTLVGTAALIACLDLVITIDTSIAHLAGAMGKKVWILLPFSADWRWLLHRNDSPWYPSAKLFRQEKLYDWHKPLSRIKRALL